MGSWNKTCGLSNLPIMGGEDTYVFVLERVNTIDDHCYSAHLYRPLLLPFEITYNDYGGGENLGGAALPVIMKALETHLVEVPQGENEYHDIAVMRKDWSPELFFRAVREHRLQISHPLHGPTQIEFVMMRRDVLDDLIMNYEFEEYVGRGKGMSGHDNSYVRYTFGDVVADVEPLLAHMRRILQDEKWVFGRMHMVLHQLLEQEGVANRAAQWLRHDLGYRYSSGLLHIRDHILEVLMQAETLTACELMIGHLKGMFVDTFMESTRKSWIPGGQEGSQSQDYAPYRALMHSMNKVMEARDADWDE